MEQYKSKLPARLRSAAEVSPNMPIATACYGSGTESLSSKTYSSGKGYGARGKNVPMNPAHMSLPHQEYNR